jgi:hypothetical protein
MIKLNLPEITPKIIKENGKIAILDLIRKKYIVLTPEEWVRQHYLNYLITHLHYPKGLIKIESGLSYNSRLKRSDIVVFDNLGKPQVLVECKAPSVPIDNQTLFQASVYNKILKAPLVVVTNGLLHYQFEIKDSGEIVALDILPECKIITS